MGSDVCGVHVLYVQYCILIMASQKKKLPQSSENIFQLPLRLLVASPAWGGAGVRIIENEEGGK